MPFDSELEQDEALSDFMVDRCYSADRDHSFGKKVIACFLHLYPRMRGKLANAARAVTGWKRLKVEKEDEPVPEEAVLVMALLLALGGWLGWSLGLLSRFDMIWREQDLEQLTTQDVVEGGEETAFLLGAAERGESVKAGLNQGSVLDRGYLRRMWQFVKAHLPDGATVFGPMSGYRRELKGVGVAVGIKDLNAHKIRKSGAADQLKKKKRTRQEVRERGRWADERSLGVYNKEHLWVRALGKLDPQVVELGRNLMADPDKLAQFWLDRVEEEKRLFPYDFLRRRGRTATVEERRRFLGDEAFGPGA